MAQYISKDALLVEIEKLKGKVDDGSSYCNGWQHALRMLELELKNLEVKEVDFEKELDKEWNKCEPTDEGMGLEIASIEHEQFDNIAKHFFELGLKAQKGEEPVSEDFEKALANEWKVYNDRGAATVDALEDNTQELAFAKGFYRGANWQRVKDQSTIELAEDHAMLAGMEKMKEEMMAKAIDGEVGYWNQRGLSVLMSLPSEFEQDDKCKIILIKED